MYKTNDDHVTVVGAGVTLHEALAAAEQLKKGVLTKQKTANKVKISMLEIRIYSYTSAPFFSLYSV